MTNIIKGIEIVWLSTTDLTNLNSGEGGTNFVDVKRYKNNGVEYPYVSGQAMRHYLREAVRRDLPEKKIMCTPDDEGQNCGKQSECLNCDLFGYMIPKKGEGAGIRISPVKVSPAIGLLDIEENSTVDFLTRKKHKEEGEKAKGDIVNVELGVNIYKCGISIDVERIGMDEEMDEKSKKLIYKPYLNPKEKIERIVSVLRSVLYLSDYSKQSRLLTDFTPDLMLISLQERYNHRLQKAFLIDENKNLHVERFKEISAEMKRNGILFLGMISGAINNETDLKTAANELKLECMTIGDAMEKAVLELEQKQVQ